MHHILERIRKIEALIAWAKSEGEKNAAMLARERILKKYWNLKQPLELKEYTVRTPDQWHKRLFVALCRKYWLRPFRYSWQKYTTVMVKVDDKTMDEILRVEYLKYSGLLEDLVEDIANDLIDKIHKGEEDEVNEG